MALIAPLLCNIKLATNVCGQRKQFLIHHPNAEQNSCLLTTQGHKWSTNAEMLNKVIGYLCLWRYSKCNRNIPSVFAISPLFFSFTSDVWHYVPRDRSQTYVRRVLILGLDARIKCRAPMFKDTANVWFPRSFPLPVFIGTDMKRAKNLKRAIDYLKYFNACNSQWLWLISNDIVLNRHSLQT